MQVPNHIQFHDLALSSYSSSDFSFVIRGYQNKEAAISSMQTQLDTANKQLSDTNRQIELLTEQIRIMNQRKFGRQAESWLLEGQLTLFDSFNASAHLCRRIASD